MNRVLGWARAGIALAVFWPSCDGQFDFDTQVLDGGVHASVDGDSNREDASVDASADRSRKEIHIACGDENSCDVSGCCSTSSGLACRDVAAGETCGGLLIQCDDNDDCAEGSVCCAEGEKDDRPCPDASCPIERVQRVHCEPAAHCATLRYVVLCNPDKPDTCTNCVASTLSGLPPGYHQCADSP